MRAVARGEVDRRPNALKGLVTSIHADTGAYACTVQLPELDLVLPRVPIATGVLGFVAPPEVGDLVLVVFAGGDLHAPFVIGRIYDDQVEPPKHEAGEVIAAFPEKSKDATSAPIGIALKTPSGGPNSLTITFGDGKVVVTLDDDKVSLVADDTKLELDSAGEATMKVGDSSVVIKKDGNVTIKAGKKLSLKATEIEIKADAKVTVAGQTIDLN